MGFSVAAAAAILFAGGLVCFSIVMGSMESASEHVREARAREDARVAEQKGTQIGLINGTTNGTAIELNLTNNGSVVIHTKTLEVLANGTLYSANVTLRAVDGVNTTNLWAPGQTLHLVIVAAVGAPASVKIVTDTGYAFVGKVN